LYDALARLARYHDFPSGVKIQTLRKANAALRKLKKWAKHAPANYQNKYCLLAAEHARVRNKKAHAIRYYDEAIRLAKENEFLQEEALANELAAKFHLAEGSEKIARYYLKEAHFCYQKWGAAAKVERMERHFPYLAVSEAKTQADDYVVETADMETIFRASKIFLEVIVLDELLKKIMEFVIRNAGAQKGVLLLQKQNKWRIEAEADGTIINVLQSLPLENSESVSDGIIHYVIRTRENVVLGDASSEGNFMNDAYVSRQRPKSVLCIPLINQGRLEGILYLENNLTTHAFTPQRISVLNMLSSQMAVSIENARLYKANELFVPRKVLSFLNKESIIDIELGNQVEKEMTVMFSDIRDFTSLSEKMTPEETFRFINDYLAVMEPLIIENNGFIDKYVGDGIMALFPNNADEALRSAISMVKTVDTFNNNRLKNKLKPVSIGIGLNTGTLMLGIIGGKNQVDTTVLSDTVNLSSRLEALTKTYGISLIISEHTCSSLADPQRYAIREIDSVTVRGMSRPVRLFEVFDGEVQEVMELKNQTLDYFQKGLGYFQYENFEEALKIFTGITEVNPNDEVAKIYVDRCKQKISLIKKVNRFN
ncbi:MAG TPA: adenylate/guanylate cyclase domain-containing protein, partial [Chitinophagales bacterium]|nr:adenylate/guanylate cyclase domain-containing protein [Chitinophagales bacterium]